MRRLKAAVLVVYLLLCGVWQLQGGWGMVLILAGCLAVGWRAIENGGRNEHDKAR